MMAREAGTAGIDGRSFALPNSVANERSCEVAGVDSRDGAGFSRGCPGSQKYGQGENSGACRQAGREWGRGPCLAAWPRPGCGLACAIKPLA